MSGKIYTATCPECGSMVAAASDKIPADHLKEDLGAWALDGLTIQVVELSQVSLAFHKDGCRHKKSADTQE